MILDYYSLRRIVSSQTRTTNQTRRPIASAITNFSDPAMAKPNSLLAPNEIELMIRARMASFRETTSNLVYLSANLLRHRDWDHQSGSRSSELTMHAATNAKLSDVAVLTAFDITATEETASATDVANRLFNRARVSTDFASVHAPGRARKCFQCSSLGSQNTAQPSTSRP